MSSSQPIKPINKHVACEHDHTHEAAHVDEYEDPTILPQACTEKDKCCVDLATSTKVISLQDTLEIPVGSIQTKWNIAQMDCPTEEALIRKNLGGMVEVNALDFNLIQRVLTVVHHDTRTTGQ
jgi:Cd2+/Zn2+-exporting ATPase